MKIKAVSDKIKKHSANGMACTGREFDLLKEGKEISVPKDVADKMLETGLIEILEEKKQTKTTKKDK